MIRTDGVEPIALQMKRRDLAKEPLYIGRMLDGVLDAAMVRAPFTRDHHSALH